MRRRDQSVELQHQIEKLTETVHSIKCEASHINIRCLTNWMKGDYQDYQELLSGGELKSIWCQHFTSDIAKMTSWYEHIMRQYKVQTAIAFFKKKTQND